MLLNSELSILRPRPSVHRRPFRRATAGPAIVVALGFLLGVPGEAWSQEVPPPPPLPPIDAEATAEQAPATAADAAVETTAPNATNSLDSPPPNVRRAADEGEDVPIPPKVLEERARVEPTVEIRRDEQDNIIEEYMLEGRVYMVKVTPRNGVPYYYLDEDGDGQLELTEKARSRGEGPVKPVYWKIKEW